MTGAAKTEPFWVPAATGRRYKGIGIGAGAIYFPDLANTIYMTALLDRARQAAEQAAAPYSEFPVGAALESQDGTVYTGCNVEIATYSDSLHAETVALGTAIADGHRNFEQLAVSAPNAPGLTPCGSCRQTVAEFVDEEFPILCDKGPDTDPARYTLGELLPAAMGPADLNVER